MSEVCNVYQTTKDYSLKFSLNISFKGKLKETPLKNLEVHLVVVTYSVLWKTGPSSLKCGPVSTEENFLSLYLFSWTTEFFHISI